MFQLLTHITVNKSKANQLFVFCGLCLVWYSSENVGIPLHAIVCVKRARSRCPALPLSVLVPARGER